MPKNPAGRKLSKKEHDLWKGAYAGSQGSADNPGAVATAAVKKYRRKKKGFKKERVEE